jgi:hypothetical protein
MVSSPGNIVVLMLIMIDSLNQGNVNSALSTEFEKVAADFFSGCAVEAE